MLSCPFFKHPKRSSGYIPDDQIKLTLNQGIQMKKIQDCNSIYRNLTIRVLMIEILKITI